MLRLGVDVEDGDEVQGMMPEPVRPRRENGERPTEAQAAHYRQVAVFSMTNKQVSGAGKEVGRVQCFGRSQSLQTKCICPLHVSPDELTLLPVGTVPSM